MYAGFIFYFCEKGGRWVVKLDRKGAVGGQDGDGSFCQNKGDFRCLWQLMNINGEISSTL
jgi:hypothetical protein